MPITVLNHELADELWEADRAANPVAPLTDRHGALTIEDAYAIQAINIDRRTTAGQGVIGRKAGRCRVRPSAAVDHPIGW